MKRGLGPRPAVGGQPDAKLARCTEPTAPESKPYSRGSLQLALSHIQTDAAGCIQRTADKARATTAAGPHASRLKT